MIPREYSLNNSSAPTTLTGTFSAEELARLSALRENFFSHSEYLERVIDQRRLEFGRWLLENGKIGEGAAEC